MRARRAARGAKHEPQIRQNIWSLCYDYKFSAPINRAFRRFFRHSERSAFRSFSLSIPFYRVRLMSIL